MDRNLPILVAEDTDAEAILLRKALERLGAAAHVHVVPDGRQAVDYLTGVGRYENREKYPFPKVFFTDLKMPCMDGFDVLRWMRENSERAVIPTIVLSSSNSPDDVKAAYQLGANAYLVKPTRFDDLQEMLTRAYQFWSWCARPECLG